jgi:hypothetical protein
VYIRLFDTKLYIRDSFTSSVPKMAGGESHAEEQGSADFSILLRTLSELQDVHLAAGSGTIPPLPTIVAIGNQSDGKSSTIGEARLSCKQTLFLLFLHLFHVLRSYMTCVTLLS